MVIAGRLSAVWQVAGVAAAALCCYLVSQSVASERAALAKADRQIARQQDAIAKLGMEIATRSRLTQVESWNHQLALQAPRPGQYVQDGLQLASLYAHDTRPQLQLNPAIVTQRGPLERAAYVAAAGTGAPPLPAPTAPAEARTASVVLGARPSPPLATNGTRMGLILASMTKSAQPDASSPEPTLRPATYVRPKPSRLAADDDASIVKHAAFHPQVVASLLSSDIASLARTEQSRRKPAKRESE